MPSSLISCDVDHRAAAAAATAEGVRSQHSGSWATANLHHWQKGAIGKPSRWSGVIWGAKDIHIYYGHTWTHIQNIIMEITVEEQISNIWESLVDSEPAAVAMDLIASILSIESRNLNWGSTPEDHMAMHGTGCNTVPRRARNGRQN